MWISFGDKYEIVPYDKEKHPRKFKFRGWAGIVIVLFMLTALSILYFLEPFGKYTTFIAALLVFAMFFMTICAKWIKNNHELDILLIINSIIMLFIAHLAWPKELLGF